MPADRIPPVRLALAVVLLGSCGAGPQRDSEPHGEPPVEPNPSAYYLRAGRAAGTLRLWPDSGVLSLDRAGGQEVRIQLDEDRPSFEPTCFRQESDTSVLVGGRDRSTRSLVLLRVPVTAEGLGPPELLHESTAASLPLALDVGEPFGIVLIDGADGTVYRLPRGGVRLEQLASAKEAPLLRECRHLRILHGQAGSSVAAVRLSDRSELELGIPAITHPRFVFLWDDDGDGVVDRIEGG